MEQCNLTLASEVEPLPIGLDCPSASPLHPSHQTPDPSQYCSVTDTLHCLSQTTLRASEKEKAPCLVDLATSPTGQTNPFIIAQDRVPIAAANTWQEGTHLYLAPGSVWKSKHKHLGIASPC